MRGRHENWHSQTARFVVPMVSSTLPSIWTVYFFPSSLCFSAPTARTARQLPTLRDGKARVHALNPASVTRYFPDASVPVDIVLEVLIRVKVKTIGS